MLTNALVEHCSPTLAGIKTGNMFSVNTDSADIISEIKNLNRIMTKKGLCLIPLKKSDTSTLIYLYRPDLLKRDLNLPEAEEILEKKGYPCGKPECCLACLVRHFMAKKLFVRYKKCKEIYCKEVREGKPLEALIVETRKNLQSAI